MKNKTLERNIDSEYIQINGCILPLEKESNIKIKTAFERFSEMYKGAIVAMNQYTKLANDWLINRGPSDNNFEWTYSTPNYTISTTVRTS